jgi:hypothetical protein
MLPALVLESRQHAARLGDADAMVRPSVGVFLVEM